jgi:hypothetical protein
MEASGMEVELECLMAAGFKENSGHGPSNSSRLLRPCNSKEPSGQVRWGSKSKLKGIVRMFNTINY